MKEKRRCEWCGAEYIARMPWARFCSSRCQKKNAEINGNIVGYIFICQHCGKEYRTRFNDRNKYCSRECAFAFGKGRKEARKRKGQEAYEQQLHVTCLECGREFERQNLHQGICSEECKRARNRRRFREEQARIGRNRGRIVIRTCDCCGQEFEQIVFNQLKKYCSRACSHAAWQRDNPEKAASIRAKSRHTRRARQHQNGAIDDIDPYIVYERDEWMCGICGRSVDPDLVFPDPHSASLDHIIPLSRGGTHTWDNVQLAHFLCNSLKRDT